MPPPPCVLSSAFISDTYAFSTGQNIDSIGLTHQSIETKWFREEKNPTGTWAFLLLISILDS
jgi:hypothetical protein